MHGTINVGYFRIEIIIIVLSVTCCRVQCVCMQLLAGAKVNDVTPQKQTALHLAAAHDRSAICAILIDSHINCDAVDDGINNG